MYDHDGKSSKNIIGKDTEWFKDIISKSQKKVKECVRLDSDTDLEKAWELLTKYWHLKNQKFHISITGGAKYFDVKPEVKSIFRKAVYHAANSTGAWIITRGTGTGIMKMLAETVHEYTMAHCLPDENIVTLGITTWGIVYNISTLESKRISIR